MGSMKIKTPTIRVILEISQEEYLKDEDYTGLDTADLLDRAALARILDKNCYHPVKITLDNPENKE